MTSKPFQAFNPATGEPGTVHPFIGDAEVNTILENAETASHSWSQREVEERAQICERISELFLERSEELARIATMEMGKPIEEMREEIEFCHDIFRYFAAKGPQQLQDTILEETAEGTSVLQRRAIGPLLGIMPWNYPYYQVARFVAPNLITGNTIILKHAEICPESA